MDFGSTIKAAREARGLTTRQVAAQTRILVQTIEGIEKNNFKMIPAPIYGRGFVKLICECLDLDPVVMIPAFMAAYNGDPQMPDPPAKEPDVSGGIRYAAPIEPEKEATPEPEQPQAQEPAQSAPEPAQPAPEPAQPPAPEPEQPRTQEPAQPAPEPAPPRAPEPEAIPASPPKTSIDTSLRGLELFDPAVTPPKPVPPPAQAPASPNAPANDFSRFAQPQDDRGFSRFAPPTANDDFSRFAAPLPEDDTPEVSAMDRFRKGLSSVSAGVLGKMKGIRRPAFRLGIVIAGIVVVLGLCIWGIVALFRATSGGNTDAAQAETPAAAVQEPSKDEAKQKQETVAKDVKSEDGGKQAEKQTAKQPEAEQIPEAPAPVQATIPLKLPGFYID